MSRTLDSMIFRKYFLDRRAQYAKEAEWVSVRVVYGTGSPELLWVLDDERGVYPVTASLLKFELPRKERELLAIERKYAYLAGGRQ